MRASREPGSGPRGVPNGGLGGLCRVLAAAREGVLVPLRVVPLRVDALRVDALHVDALRVGIMRVA